MQENKGKQKIWDKKKTDSKDEYIPNHINNWASLVAQLVKNLPAVQETWVPSQGWEDPLEEGVATHFSVLAWRIPWTEEPVGLQSIESPRVGHD